MRGSFGRCFRTQRPGVKCACVPTFDRSKKSRPLVPVRNVTVRGNPWRWGRARHSAGTVRRRRTMDAMLRLVSHGVNADRKRIGSGSDTGRPGPRCSDHCGAGNPAQRMITTTSGRCWSSRACRSFGAIRNPTVKHICPPARRYSPLERSWRRGECGPGSPVAASPPSRRSAPQGAPSGGLSAGCALLAHALAVHAPSGEGLAGPVRSRSAPGRDLRGSTIWTGASRRQSCRGGSE